MSCILNVAGGFTRRFNALNECSEVADRAFTSAYYWLQLVEQVGNLEVGDKAHEIGEIFAKAQVGLSALRLFYSIMECLSLRMFRSWDRKTNSWEIDKDNPTAIVWRAPSMILARLCIATGRAMSFIFVLNRAKVIDLGKHAKGMGYAVSGIWCCVVSIYAVISVTFVSDAHANWKNARTVKEKEDALWDLKYAASGLFVSSLDVVSTFIMSGAAGEVLKSNNPYIPIATTAFVGTASLLYSIYELVFEVPHLSLRGNKPRNLYGRHY